MEEVIVDIKTRLSVREVSDDLIKSYYKGMSVVALSIVKEDTDLTKEYVKEAIIELINRQGDEGIASANGGSQTYTYEDAVENLKKRLLPHRKGVKCL